MSGHSIPNVIYHGPKGELWIQIDNGKHDEYFKAWDIYHNAENNINRLLGFLSPEYGKFYDSEIFRYRHIPQDKILYIRREICTAIFDSIQKSFSVIDSLEVCSDSSFKKYIKSINQLLCGIYTLLSTLRALNNAKN